MRPSDAMAAVLRFDRPALDHAVTAPPAQSDDATTLEQALTRAWLDVASGEQVDLTALERRAAGEGEASLVVRIAAVQALGLATTGQLDDALEVARRASRMGRTEALPEAEYLAALVLARVRRSMGRPYLATRILTALAGYVPEPWHAWVSWELLMASGGRGPLPASGPAAAFLDALAHLDQGHGAHWRNATGALATRVAGFSFLHQDVQRALAGLDPTSASDDPELVPWRSGDEPHRPPHGLQGLMIGAAAAAYVVAGPGWASRRLLHRGAPLVGGHVMPPTQRRQARTDGLLAGLALAGSEGIDEAKLFRIVYGFKYARDVHKEVLHVAIHRARERLGELGEIRRDGSRLTLALGGPVLFPDPRCTPAVDDRVLQLVAKRGSVTAKDAAGALGIPLRSAQTALKDLVEGGACTSHRKGRKVAYAVEDTTFREPTFS